MSFLYIAAVLAEEESMQNHWRLIVLFVSLPQDRRNDLSMRITMGPIHQSEPAGKMCNDSKNKCSDIYLINARR